MSILWVEFGLDHEHELEERVEAGQQKRREARKERPK